MNEDNKNKAHKYYVSSNPKLKSLNYLAYPVVSCLQSMSMGCAIFINFIWYPLPPGHIPIPPGKLLVFPMEIKIRLLYNTHMFNLII